MELNSLPRLAVFPGGRYGQSRGFPGLRFGASVRPSTPRPTDCGTGAQTQRGRQNIAASRTFHS